MDLTLTDYYFPNTEGEGGDWFNFDSPGGAHYLELMGSLTFSETFPISLAAAWLFYNDDDNSIYLEGSVPFSISDVDLGITLGLVAGESAFYGVAGTSLVNLGLSASKNLEITEKFTLPLTTAYIINPTFEKSYLVFGFSIAP